MQDSETPRALQAYEVMLTAHEGERDVMIALVHGVAGLVRRAAIGVARCFAITPHSHLLR